MRRETKRISPDELPPDMRQRYEQARRAAPEVRRLIEQERVACRSVRRAIASLQSARESAGLTRHELAGRAGLDSEVIRQMEEGDIFELDLGDLVRYADALGKQVLIQIADDDRDEDR